MILSASNIDRLNDNSSENMETILSDDIVLKGSIECQGELISDGRIEGTVITKGNLIVGDSGSINGNIETVNMTLFGTVEGNAKVSEKCIVKSTAELDGDVEAGTIKIEEGAVFSGKFSVGKKKNRKKSNPAPAETQVNSAVEADQTK